MKVATAEIMRKLDRRAIEEFGIPGMVLMENAARGTVRRCSAIFRTSRPGALASWPAGEITEATPWRSPAICSTEVASRYTSWLPGGNEGDAATNLEILRRMGRGDIPRADPGLGIPARKSDPQTSWSMESWVRA